MKTSVKQQRAVAVRAGGLTAVAGAVLVLASAAQAQTTPPAQTITVTGIRAGIESAINVKKNSDSIVEAVSAEDIGKLPDTSIAESIARLPGVAAQRTNGRAQQISIRGMGPDFATGLLNGREQVSTGDSRAVEFDQFPSELLSGVTIYKTPDAGLLGQGLSGTIDMQTVRPLDFGSRAVAVNYRKQRLGVGTGQAEGDGSRFSISYIDQFADRTIGVAVGFARLDETGASSTRFESWGTADAPWQGGTVKVPGGFNSFVDQTVQTRDGAVAVLQYKPNKNFSSTLDVFYSKFDQNVTNTGFQAPLWYGSGGANEIGRTLTAATVANGVATGGTFGNFKGLVRIDNEKTVDKLHSFGWKNVLTMGDWTGTADIAQSKVQRRGTRAETTAGLPGDAKLGGAVDTISWTGFDGNNVSGATFTPGLNYSDRSVIKLTDVEGWGGSLPQAGYSKLPHIDDKIDSFRLSGKRDLPEGWFFAAADIGVAYTDRKKTRAFTEGRLVIPGADRYAAADIPGSGTLTVSGIPIAVWDPTALVGSVYEIAAKLVPDIANKDWTVKEKVSTVYSKLDVDSKLLGLPVRGNAGVQLVHTNQSSNAFNIDNTSAACPGDVCAVRDVTRGTTYTDVLPSANLIFDLGGDQVVRLGAARVLARPTINDMRASMGFGVNATADNGQPVLKGSGGNPELKPFRANALDIAYEKYFGTKAYFGAAAFYKSLRTYILKVNTPFDFTPYITSTTPLPATGPNAGSPIGLMETPINGSGGSIRGVELSGSVPLNLLTPMLDGFGVVASYSNTNSSVKLPISGLNGENLGTLDVPLPGLSKQVSSLTLYFEKAGFSARVAARHRSKYLGEVTDFAGDRRLTFMNGETVTDLQLGYEIQSGFAKGLSILFQANNIGNTPEVRSRPELQTNGSINDVETFRKKYGKTYLFGLNYKL